MRFLKLSDWLAWQEQLHPKAIELGLGRVSEVWSVLCTRPFSCPVISIAGTNGKGSSIAMLQAIYTAAGYRVGTYTSPHIWHYHERIRINGIPVPDEAICQSFERIDQARKGISLTYFEFGTLAALDIFQQHDLDVILLEVGMGGRLDAVNIIDADIALISSIDLDHQQWLGEDRETIAREKAGIMRKNGVAVCSDSRPPESLSIHASELGTKLFLLNRDFRFETDGGHWNWYSPEASRLALPRPALDGAHQIQNAAGVLMVLELLQDRLPVNQSQLRTGLLSTRIAGRFMYSAGEVGKVYDVAHNPAAVQQLARVVEEFWHHKCIHGVFSCLSDKDIPGLIQPLCSCIDHWYLAPLSVSRSASLPEMESALLQACPEVRYDTAETIQLAFDQACHAAAPGDLVLVYGSFYTVAQTAKESL